MIDLLADLAPYIFVGGICLIVGAALGYHTAMTDRKDSTHDR